VGIPFMYMWQVETSPYSLKYRVVLSRVKGENEQFILCQEGGQMLKTQQLEHILKIALLTPYIKGERPVSLLVVARVESGKTEMIKKMELGAEMGIGFMTDLTAWGLQTKYLDDIASGKIRTIVVPDLITPLSRSSDTVETLISFLNALIEEGVCEIQTFAKSIQLKVPARCNVITSIAKDYLSDRRHRWTKSGFMSRVIPVTYAYKASTVFQIAQSIARREYRSESSFSSLALPREETEIELPLPIASQLAELAPRIVDSGRKAEELYGFRLQKQLQTMCMANAMLNGRDIVTQEDFDTIVELGDFMNFNYNPI